MIKNTFQFNPFMHGVFDQPRDTGGGFYSLPGYFSLKAYKEGKNDGGNFPNLIKYDVKKGHKKIQSICLI